jgi:hypothetical protein
MHRVRVITIVLCALPTRRFLYVFTHFYVSTFLHVVHVFKLDAQFRIY